MSKQFQPRRIAAVNWSQLAGVSPKVLVFLQSSIDELCATGSASAMWRDADCSVALAKPVAHFTEGFL
jgi:hypothetical protein